MTVLTGDTVLRVAPSVSWSYEGQRVMLRAGGRVLRYEGSATTVLQRVLPLFDGVRGIDSIVDELGDVRLRPAVLKLCDRLMSDGLLHTPPGDGGADDVFERMLGERAPSPSAYPPISTVKVAGRPEEVAAIAQVAPEKWQVAPITLTDLPVSDADDGVCAVVWLSDPNDPLLAEWNESAYHNRHAWLPISHFDGEVAIVGPYIRPRDTPCFECYRRRRAARSSLGEGFLSLQPLDREPFTSKALTAFLAAVAVALLQDWSARSNPNLPGAVRTVTFQQGLQLSTEHVLRVPRCPACRPTAEVARPTLWSEHWPLRSDA